LIDTDTPSFLKKQKFVVKVLRPDPFAMKPFCGYHIGDYFNHWLKIGSKTTPDKLPKIFHVNWFKKSSGKFLWPGFGENARVLKWIFERTANEATAEETAIGYLPTRDSLDVSGLDIDEATLSELLRVEPDEYLSEISRYREFFATLGNKLPAGIKRQADELEKRLTKVQATKA